MISIDTLPDDALLLIFDHYMNIVRLEGGFRQKAEDAWHSLVHVCRRWRCIVFESPRRLDLRLVCTGETPARDGLDLWPALPLIIWGEGEFSTGSGDYVDNIVAALERADRVCQIHLENFLNSEMEIILAAMQRPYPELTHLGFWPSYQPVPDVPDSFLGGSVPRLEHLTLWRFPFPGLPKLLLSATHLRYLLIENIPHSGYFPPDAIVTALSTLTSLDYLELGFRSPPSFPDRASRCPPPSTRSILPVLTTFVFGGVSGGVSEYLEDLVAGINAPKLDRLGINFFNDTVFDTPQLIRFISCAPKLKAPEKANITIYHHVASVKFSSRTYPSRDRGLEVKIWCNGLNWQLSSLVQVCTSCLPFLSLLEDLYFYEDLRPDWKENIDNELWVDLLRPFGAVKNLHLSKTVASRVAPALQELVEGRTTEVLPTVLPNLENIFVVGLESFGPAQEGIEQFVAARQVAGHPTAFSNWTNYEEDRQGTPDSE